MVLANPISSELDVMWLLILLNLLDAVACNQDWGFKFIVLFEVGL